MTKGRMEEWNVGKKGGGTGSTNKAKQKSNHESTKVRKHERRGVYLDTLALFRAFQFSCFRDWFLLWFLESLGR